MYNLLPVYVRDKLTINLGTYFLYPLKITNKFTSYPTLQDYFTKLYYTIFYYTIFYYTILYYTILYHTILYYTILNYTIPYYTIQLYNTIQYNTILCYTILYYTILYFTILYYTILYYTILYYTILYYTILYSYTILLEGYPEEQKIMTTPGSLEHRDYGYCMFQITCHSSVIETTYVHIHLCY